MTASNGLDSLAFLFDLDGTLVDSVYQHVLAWREATQAAGIELPVWRIHRQIGMSGGLMLHALRRETGRPVSKEEAERIRRVHAEAFARQAPSLRVLPGAQELLDTLAAARVPYAIATLSLIHIFILSLAFTEWIIGVAQQRVMSGQYRPQR